MSTSGVAPAGTGVSVLGAVLAKGAISEQTPAFTGQPTLLLVTVAVGLLTAGFVFVFFGREVAELPCRELDPPSRRANRHPPKR